MLLILLSVLPLTQDAEPARVMQLTVNGKQYYVDEGKSLQLPDAGGQPLTIKAALTDQRYFRYGGMSFRYPSELKFESDHSDGTRQWDMLGRVNDLTVFETPISARRFLQAYVRSFVQVTQVKDQKPVLKTGSIKVAGRNLRTWQCTMALTADDSFEFWGLELPPYSGGTRLLMFDMEYDDGKLSAQTIRIRDLVLESLEFESSADNATAKP